MLKHSLICRVCFPQSKRATWLHFGYPSRRFATACGTTNEDVFKALVGFFLLAGAAFLGRVDGFNQH